MKKFIFPWLVVAVLSGCANTRFNVNGEIGVDEVPRYEDRQTYFISGLGQKQTVDAVKICGSPDKVKAVAKEHTFLDGVLSAFTFGIYTPETARVYCK